MVNWEETDVGSARGVHGVGEGTGQQVPKVSAACAWCRSRWSPIGHSWSTHNQAAPPMKGPWAPRPQAGALTQGPSADQNYRVPTCPYPGQGREEWATGGGPLPLLRPDSRTAEGSQGSRWVFGPKRTPTFGVCQGAHNPDKGSDGFRKWLWLKYGRLDCQKQITPERLLTRLFSTWFL